MIVADKTPKMQNCGQKYDFLKRCLPSSHRKYETKIQIPAKTFWGAWRDRDTNDIFAYCSLIFCFLDLKFSRFVSPSELHPVIWFFFKNSFRKRKIQYVSVIAWVFDFGKFITTTDVSLQAMYIACAQITSLCSQYGFIHESKST